MAAILYAVIMGAALVVASAIVVRVVNARVARKLDSQKYPYGEIEEESYEFEEEEVREMLANDDVEINPIVLLAAARKGHWFAV